MANCASSNRGERELHPVASNSCREFPRDESDERVDERHSRGKGGDVSDARRRTRGTFYCFYLLFVVVNRFLFSLLMVVHFSQTGVIVRFDPNSGGGESDDDFVRRVRARRDWYGRERVPFKLDSDKK